MLAPECSTFFATRLTWILPFPSSTIFQPGWTTQYDQNISVLRIRHGRKPCQKKKNTP
jgi:hypothetical protein